MTASSTPTARPWLDATLLPEVRAISPAYSTWLDGLRWGAALLVCISHVRSVVLDDHVAGQGLLPLAFFWIHGFGHQAVVVFFVLSGYLIGGEIVRALRHGTFDWRVYGVRRFSRLYVVYVAALLAGALWDQLGLRYFNVHGVYNFDGQAFPMIYYRVAERLTPGVFAGNLAFLQTITVPTFGSNTPLWSLANEAWYYALCPLLLWPLFTTAPLLRRGLALALGLAAAWFVRGEVLDYFLLWLAGLAPHFLRRRLVPAWLPATLGLALLTVIRLHLLPDSTVFVQDLALGALVVLLLNALEHGAPHRAAPGPARLHHALAGFSYSLYLVHWPFGLFLACAAETWWDHGYRLAWGVPGLATYIAVLALVYGFAWLVAQGTERHTAALRRRLLAWTAGAPRTTPAS